MEFFHLCLQYILDLCLPFHDRFRWGKRSTGMDMLVVDEDEPHYVRYQREASPLRWGKRFYDEDKRAPLRWGKRAPSR